MGYMGSERVHSATVGLRHCATSQKVTSSIPDQVNGIVYCLVNKANLVHNFS